MISEQYHIMLRDLITASLLNSLFASRLKKNSADESLQVVRMEIFETIETANIIACSLKKTRNFTSGDRVKIPDMYTNTGE